MRMIALYLLLLLFSGCDGILSNHYALRAHEPLDGTYGNSRFDTDDVSYTQGNLKYLSNKNKRNNNIYYASAEKYNTINYNIAKDYVINYQKFLKVDAKELENGLKNEQYGVKSGDILKKMEAGVLPKHPMKGNVEIMQTLKDEKNKIAFPDYMDEYLDVYNDKIDDIMQNCCQNDQDLLNNNEIHNLNNRDEYVEYYFNTLNGKPGGKELYKEELIQ